MPSIDRRQFLRLAGASVLATSLPASIRRALAIPADSASGSIMDVQHVVILMQENRAFDHYFGTLMGVRGYGDRITIPLPGGRSVWQQMYEPQRRIILPYHLDQNAGNAQRVTGTPHTWVDTHNAWANGRLDAWPTYKMPWSMGYYEEAEVPFQRALANAFTLCDNYHCSVASSTHPNRIFMWTGYNDPDGRFGGPAISNANTLGTLGPPSQALYRWKTYPERLQEAGVSWKVYQNLPNNFGCNELVDFENYCRANEAHGNGSDGAPYPSYQPGDDQGNPLYKGIANTLPGGGPDSEQPLQAFIQDINAGQLPQVSWIVPSDIYSEHPGPSSPVQGGWYAQQVLDALTANPQVFAKTVFILTYDENDGFFDHVPAPAAPSLDEGGRRLGQSTIDLTGETHSDGLLYGPGPRVPCILISPWSRGGWVCSETFDHTSILRFLEARFGVTEENITPWRRAICGDLTGACNFFDPNNDQTSAIPGPNKADADALRSAQDQREQLPIPFESSQQLPLQPTGSRPSRALPYELHATAAVADDQVSIFFENTGNRAAVFHVYDRLHLDQGPRRYGVEPGKSLQDVWDTSQDDAQYDLWVLSTNGWHRHFQGNSRAPRQPEISVNYDGNGDLVLQPWISGEAVTLTVHDLAYGLGGPWTLRPSQTARIAKRFDLQASGHWYDFEVRLQGDSTWKRRLAGRVETGAPSISDPGFGRG